MFSITYTLILQFIHLVSDYLSVIRDFRRLRESFVFQYAYTGKRRLLDPPYQYIQIIHKMAQTK